MKTSRSILLLLLISLHPTAYADCPDCYKDQTPLTAAHGLSADGRVKIVVGIMVGSVGDSWANPPGTNIPDPRLAAAAGQGMTMWNNATDSNGNKINYYFDTITGSQPVNSVDVVIVKVPRFNSDGTENEAAEMETGGGRPYKLLVREDLVARMGDADLAGMVAHELGHRIGLDNKECAGTIMQQAGPATRRVDKDAAEHRLGAGCAHVQSKQPPRHERDLQGSGRPEQFPRFRGCRQRRLQGR